MAKPKRKKPAITYEAPTPEQMAKGAFAQGGKCATGLNDRNGLAYRRIPVIDTMAQIGKLTKRQHFGLARYRDLAEDSSPLRDSTQALLQSSKGDSVGLPGQLVRMTIGKGGWNSAAHFLECELGALLPIAHAVAVQDVTVSQWAASKGGTNADGSPKRMWLETCMIDIRMAGERLAAAIGA